MTRTINALSYSLMAGFLAWLGFHLIGLPRVGNWALIVAMPAWLVLIALTIGLLVSDAVAYLRLRG